VGETEHVYKAQCRDEQQQELRGRMHSDKTRKEEDHSHLLRRNPDCEKGRVGVVMICSGSHSKTLSGWIRQRWKGKLRTGLTAMRRMN
jgi:hypothetical protein